MLSIILTLIHWIIDSIKVFLLEKNTKIEKELFIADQTLHIITILVLWFTYFNMWNLLTVTITIPFTNYNFSLLLLAYLWLIYPVSFLMKYVSQSIAENINPTPKNNDVEKEHGGKKIGQFERVIILTLVLLKQYEAIGFLITGKSIIRFADHNSNLRSEYVLVGTMMSYAIAILTGVCVNYLLSN
jgi:hypothetical protein